MDMGMKIKLLRTERKLTMEQLAEMADTSHVTISKTERGLNNDISLSIITGIAEALGVSLDWLVDEDQGYPPPERVEKRRERSRR